jgi:hypothetical protein
VIRQTLKYYRQLNTEVPALRTIIVTHPEQLTAAKELHARAIVRTYYPGLPSANAWTTGLPAANKSAVIVSFKAQPTTILSGKDDAALSHFFDTAPPGIRSTGPTITNPRATSGTASSR